MKCYEFKTKTYLGYPMEFINFISYPSFCNSFGVLAKYKLTRVVFPSKLDSPKPISILTHTTNTLLFTEDCDLVTFDMIEPNRPYDIYFDEVMGGYVLVIPKCLSPVKKKVEKEPIEINNVKKEVGKK